MKMRHVNLGEVELVGELGKGPNGRTIIKHKGQTIEASTGYLKPLKPAAANDQPSATDSGTGAGN